MLLVQVVHDNNNGERLRLYQELIDVPRNGEYIEFPDGRIGFVDQVTWKLVPEPTHLKPNIVEVLVRFANGGQS